jgi:hypothetical protein
LIVIYPFNGIVLVLVIVIVYYDYKATVVTVLTTVADNDADVAVKSDEADETHIKLPSKS